MVKRKVVSSDAEDSDSLEVDFSPLPSSVKVNDSLFLTVLTEEMNNISDNLRTKQNFVRPSGIKVKILFRWYTKLTNQLNDSIQL